MYNHKFLVSKSYSFLVVFTFLFSCFATLNAQDIEPRRWTPIPLGVHVIGGGYVHTFGDLIFDPVLQAEDVTIAIHAAALSFVQPLKVGNKLGRIDVLLPYADAKWDGLLRGVPTAIRRTGFSDPRVRFSINLIGPQALDAKGMLDYYKENPNSTMLGASVSVTFPLGQYAEDRLLNLGQNRFVIRPQIGFVHNWGLWSYELTASVFFYTINSDFFNNQERKQDPTFAIQTHLIKRFKNRMWASISAGYGLGGQSIVNSQPNNDERGDFLSSLALGAPITKRQSVKVFYLHSESVKSIGSDTNSIGFGYSVMF
ncbi:transporter [Hanstruepera marina]|uniref:transporter n=1 Tax=Hanstruepera marina TaxID=2873265 RepID=UPI002106C4A3|nr:transporter [Hanstruepera marina]